MTNVISGINIYYYKSFRKPFILFSCRTSCTTISYNLEVTYGKHSSQNRKSGETIRRSHRCRSFKPDHPGRRDLRSSRSERLWEDNYDQLSAFFFPMIKETLKFSVRRSHRPIISSSHRSVLSCRMWRFSMN